MKKKTNIVWLHSHFLYWMGGTKFIHQVIKEMKKSANIGSIYIIVENKSDFAKKQYKDLGVELISLNSLTSTSPIYWVFLSLFIINDYLKIRNIFIKKKIKSNNTVVISSMFPMSFIAYLLGFKHIQNCYEPFAFFYDKYFISQFSLIKKIFVHILSFIYSPFDKFATKKANLVLTLNNTTQKMIKKVYSLSSKKTQAGVNSLLFKPYISSKIRKKYQGKKVAIHSTDYSPVKGTDLVIKAFAKAAKSIPKARLLITTTIEDKERKLILKNLAKKLKVGDKVKFLGFLPIKELPQYYSLANVMIQGAFSENSGTTSMSLPIKEAMCCETPAIRPNVGGEDVEDNKTGFLVDPRDTDLLAEKIKILLLDKKLSKKMGKKARVFIKNKYTWQNTANVFIKSCH
jgi:glycosyltransferase involved in cell wall biosynthesis